jgi:hypothetical protein
MFAMTSSACLKCTWITSNRINTSITLSCGCHCRASYQQQYEAALSAIQAQQATNLAEIASVNRFLQDIGLPPQQQQQQPSRPGTPAQQQQQQQQQRGGPQLVSRLQGLKATLEARAAAQRAAQQQLEAQVCGTHDDRQQLRTEHVLKCSAMQSTSSAAS